MEARSFGEFPAWWEAETKTSFHNNSCDVLHWQYSLRKVDELSDQSGC
jgi:hypothetical protein